MDSFVDLLVVALEVFDAAVPSSLYFQVAQVLSYHTSTYWDGEIPEQSHTQNTKTQSFVIMFGLSAQLAQQHT